jgi:hypothetical protein
MYICMNAFLCCFFVYMLIYGIAKWYLEFVSREVNSYVCIKMCIYIYLCMYIYAHIHTFIYVYMYLYIHVHMIINFNCSRNDTVVVFTYMLIPVYD